MTTKKRQTVPMFYCCALYNVDEGNERIEQDSTELFDTYEEAKKRADDRNRETEERFLKYTPLHDPGKMVWRPEEFNGEP